MSEHTITVAVDPKLHSREPDGEAERLTWAFLDTTWNLMREYAVRVTLAEIRSQAAERGDTLPSDEELFKEARESGDPDAPTGYLDLAPENGLSAAGLAGAFEVLAEQAFRDAAEGLGFTIA